MRSGEGLQDGDDRLPVEALAAGLAALCAAALALGAFDGAPPEHPRGRLAATGYGAGLAAAGGRGPAAAPVPRLCFRGARGEPVDFPAGDEHCPPTATDAGPRLAGAP